MKKIVIRLVSLFMVTALVEGLLINSAFATQSLQNAKGQRQSVYSGQQNQNITSKSVKNVTQVFLDLPQSNWAYKYIMDMKNKGILKGNKGKFYPEKQATRAEFATMLVKGLRLAPSQNTGQAFTDVPKSFWAYNNIEAAKNYLTGYKATDGSMFFSPGNPALREDIIVAMVKAKGMDGQQADLSVLNKFVDANKISDGLKKYVAIAVKNGLVSGSVNKQGNHQLNPQSKVTRAEAAAFLYRVMQIEKPVSVSIIAQ